MHTLRTGLILACSIVMGGCAQTQSWLDTMRSPSSGGGGGGDIIGAPDIDQYLRELHALSTGDPATQAEIFADAEASATLTPDPSTRLRYALVLATPGHTGADAVMAESLLRELLTQTELMTTAEVALATIHLKSSEQQLVLAAEAARLRESSNLARRTEEAAVGQRLAVVEAENRRLRRQLADVESKLEAITSIERTIREQDQ